jgi:hypothetical protein
MYNLSMNRRNDEKDKVYAALFRLYCQKKELTKENFSSTLDLKPINVTEERWWAMLCNMYSECHGQ